MNINFVGNKFTNKSSRSGTKIIAIVNHITACSKDIAISWFTSSSNKESSCHYLVGKDGSICQFVEDNMKSWHAGIVQKPTAKIVLQDMKNINPNNYTIGIEHEGQTGDALTEAQYQATLWLHQQLISKYNIPVDGDHILGHYQIDGVNRKYCPGTGFPWGRLMTDLNNYFAPKPQVQQWQIDAVKFLKDSKIITSDHDPNKLVTMGLFGFMMNNYLDKLPKIDPTQYLVDKGFTGQKHSADSILTWKVLGWMFARRNNVQTNDPVQFLLQKGYITSSKNPDDQISFSLLGAVLKNAISKNLTI
jgi:N-acetyl-anhydromuramyl-L-alanine amidase AmpD